MAERSHPDDPGYRGWSFTWRLGFIPWIRFNATPWKDLLYWCYGYANRFAAGKDVLDSPCGMGWGTSLLAGCRSTVGIDISAEAVAEARRRYPDAADFRVMSMEKLEFPDESLDVVLCIEGIEHVPEPVAAAFVAEAERVLRRDGTLIISSPQCRDGRHSGNPYHVREYSPEELREVIGGRFAAIETMQRDCENMTITLIRAEKRRCP